MKKTLIRTTECPACGAWVAAHLALCPYCDRQLADHEGLPPELREAVHERLGEINSEMTPSLLQQILAWVAAVAMILVLPAAAAAILGWGFGSWALAGVFLAAALAISLISGFAFHEYFTYSDFLEQRLWRRRHRRELERFLVERGLPADATYEVILDFLTEKGAPTYYNLSVAFDE